MCVLLSAKAGWEGEEAGGRVRPGGKVTGSQGGRSRYVGGRKEGEGMCSHWKEHKFSDIQQQQSLRHTAKLANFVQIVFILCL